MYQIAVRVGADDTKIGGVHPTTLGMDGEVHGIAAWEHQPLIKIPVDYIVTDATNTHLDASVSCLEHVAAVGQRVAGDSLVVLGQTL